MMKILLVMTVWALSEASYSSRMASLKMRSPVAFRPGVTLHRPGYPQRITPIASRRAPYVLYRNYPHRYAMKHVNPSPIRNIFSPWKTTRLPIAGATADYDFVRAASSPVIHADGAIHTIPAPNLSLSEKPIVVIDSSESTGNEASEAPKPTYEVTEKYADQPIYQPSAKIEPPIGFSKASTMSASDLQNIMRNNAALQLASEYGLPIQLSQPASHGSQSSMIPQQFSMQGFNGMTNPQDFRGTEGFLMPPNAMHQQFPTIFQQFPMVEFFPFTHDFQPQVQTQTPETETPLYLLQNEQMNEQIIKQPPSSFVPSDNEKNIVERETQESSIASLVPQAFTVKNVSENIIDVDITTASPIPHNLSIDLVPTETQSPTTTAKQVVETNTENHKTAPVYYAQIGQSVGNVIANGFYTALNDVRAATIAAETDKIESVKPKENITTTTVSSTTQRETKALYIQDIDKLDKVDELKNLIASPFEKTAESVNVAYTLLRAKEKQTKVNQDGEVFAGQLVEAKISEDQDFNKEKANLASRPPLRLFAVTEKRVSESTPQRSVVKAKIPPKSKLTFDDKTGEPVLRVYASYVDNPQQKQIVTTKLANMKRKDVTRKQENVDRKTDAVKSLDKDEATDINHMAQFGLKIKSRSDDYMPIFDDYEE